MSEPVAQFVRRREADWKALDDQGLIVVSVEGDRKIYAATVPPASGG